jgi:hypothetical protein
LVYALFGQGNLEYVSIVQAVLFILMTVEVYVLSAFIFKKAWFAFLIGLLVGINIPLLSFVKPPLSEDLALWLLTSLALAVVAYIRTPKVSLLWLVTFWTLLLFMTRPEWMFLPVPMFIYLCLVAIWRGVSHHMLLHAIVSVALLYSVLGGYVYINAMQNQFVGVTWIENINAFGKVLQYNMQDESSPHYGEIKAEVDAAVKKGIRDPYFIFHYEPVLGSKDAVRVGAYATSIIEHHPVEFISKSVPYFFSSSTVFYEETRLVPSGRSGLLLTKMDSMFRSLYQWNVFFPVCAMFWLILLCWRRTRKRPMVQMIGAIVLLSFYGLIITTLGAYRGYDEMRIHVVFDPLMMLTLWGTLLSGIAYIIKQIWHRQSLLLLFALFLMLFLNGCAGQSGHGSADVVPVYCHSEYGIGIVFITLENHGDNAGPSTMALDYATSISRVPHVHLTVKAPPVPYEADILVMANLPFAPGTGNFLLPAGKITISMDAYHLRSEKSSAGHVLVTDCRDAI